MISTVLRPTPLHITDIAGIMEQGSWRSIPFEEIQLHGFGARSPNGPLFRRPLPLPETQAGE
jgi:hypothetical protein